MSVELKPVSTWKPHGPLRDDERLYFLHVPKTAGTSLRTYLESRFPAEEVCPHLLLPELLPHPPSELDRYRLFCGHHGLYLRSVLREEPVIVTAMRDPLQRTISHFRHLQATKHDWQHERVKNMTFEEFVMSEDGFVGLLNVQCRFLTLDNIRGDYFGHSQIRHRDPGELREKYSDPSVAERAKQLLDRAAFVGVQERFNDMLQLLAYTFGWSPITTFPAFNRAQVPFDRGQLTDAVLERIRELTALDQEVYDHARELFDSRFAAVTPEDQERSYQDAMARLPRLSQVRYGFETPVSGENWMVRERGPAQSNRWTGPGTSTTMDLPLASDTPLVLRFMVGARAADVIESLRVFVNDERAPTDWWPLHDPPKPQRVYEVLLTPDVLRKNPTYTRLRFEVDRTVVPSKEFPGEKDSRSLALYFFWLEVFPEKV